MNNCSNQRKNRGIFISIFILIVVFGVFTYGKVDAEAAILRTGVVTANSLNVRKGASTSYALVKYGKSNVYLKKNTVVNITNENASWYKITFSYSNSKRLITGYVKKQYIKIKLPVLIYKGTVKASVLNVRKSYSTSSSNLMAGNKKIQLKKNQVVNIIGSKKGWYNIAFTHKGTTKKGYVIDDYLVKSTVPGTITTNNVLLRTGADTSCNVVKVNKNNVKLSKNTKVIILGVAGNWYYLQTKFNGKTVKWYVYGTYVKRENEPKPTETDKPTETEKPDDTGNNDNKTSGSVQTTDNESDKLGTTIATLLNVRTGPSTVNDILEVGGKEVKLVSGTIVNILDEKNDWYYISFVYDGKMQKGYVSQQYIKVKGATSDKGCYGIDVSQYQNSIDLKKVKASGIEFAIIRATKFSSNGENGTNLIKDAKFDINMKNAIAAGLKVGVYVYSYAKTKAEAVNEAKLVLKYVKDYKLVYPIYYDIEEGSRQKTSLKAENTSFCKAFCDTVIGSGYKAGVYTGASFFSSYLNVGELNKYDLWIARYVYSGEFALPSQKSAVDAYINKTYMYNPSSGLKNKYTNIDADIWQYSSNGRVDGTSGRIDMNFSYKCY